MPVPQEKMFFVGWAGEPVLVIFARGLLLIDQPGRVKSPLASSKTRFLEKTGFFNVGFI
jgi:hypothetical protein